ncbi:MAG TPA: gluconate:H+ symporter [Verrucomicrobiota bacterium]|nr:gluconate:H+ symporter [Verrucomicrobiota bacterium]
MLTPTDWKLILLALAAIGVLVLLITRFKVNPFISLLLASLMVGAGAVATGRLFKDAAGKEIAYTMVGVAKSFTEGIGATLGSIAAIVGLGTMLGKLLAESGGAEVLAKRFAAYFGPQRIQWCIMALALAVGLTTWFAVGLVLLLPILLTLTHETKQPFLSLTLPLLSCLSVMHGVMPPHPGPVVAVEFLKVEMGQVLFWGFVIGIPTAAVAGPLFARWAIKHVEAHPPPMPRKSDTLPPGFRLPGFGLTLFSILLPVLLMLLATVAELVPVGILPKGHLIRESFAFIGNPTIALTGAVLFASWSLGLNCGYNSAQVLKFTESCIGTVGMTILVIGGGGGFARVLRDSGVAESIGRLGEAAHLSPLLYGWLVSAFIRVATGSATVAITTASGLLVPVMAMHPELDQTHKALIVVAIGCGSLFLSHLNDSGFWIVKDSLGLSVGQTLRTWTVCETIVGITGMLFSLAVYSVI